MPERDLLVLTEQPLNAETKLEERTPPIVPAGRHYVRTHFPIPEAAQALIVDAESPRSVSLLDVRALPARTLAVTLECAGNGRRFLEPAVPGEQWGLGAVGTAEWTGASLRSVLELAAFPRRAVEVLFRGADSGVPKDLGKQVAYERSLPVDVALGDDVLVTYAMNGEPIPPEHGGPLRLVVPGWYGMASVKWLSRITPLDQPFAGFFQRDRYVIDGRPLREIAPRAVITHPRDGDEVPAPLLEVRGYAWSGIAPIERVDVSVSDDVRVADLDASPSPYAWRAFRMRLLVELAARGSAMSFELVARATDAAGNTQPLGQRWNALGYMNNAARPVRIRVKS
ncbi:MAG TPA: sulfite oxidase [Candidatus Limnocylindria bacterium]|nr:sulfite oxidase [Candidatus Limnocylindria bacterium]